MASLSQYVVGPDMEMYFVDKDTGAPLSAGVITFYSDNNRTVLKNVYQQTGPAGGPYTYTPLPNPVTLSSVGTFEDNNGNNVIPYYLPYDTNGNLELYYITVYSSANVLQFTRSGWPPGSFTNSNTNSSTQTFNYIPNPQFLFHNDIAATATLPAGQITATTTTLAQGGWTYERSSNLSTDFVLFTQFNPGTTNPTGNPRFGCEVKCTAPNAGDTFKRLCVSFRDVDKFASSTQNYTFAFNAKSNSGSVANVSINLIDNYGTGGSPSSQVITPVGSTIVIGTTYTTNPYQLSFLFPVNSGKVLGTNNDDNVQIAIYLPAASAFDVTFTDFQLIIGNVTLTGFLDTTNADMLSRGVAGWMPTPNPDGSDLYLPLVLTQAGMTFDHSEVATIVAKMTTVAVNNELICDGSSYQTIGYSALGIPYSRLQKVLFNATLNAPIFGTGVNWVNTYINSGNTAQLILSCNQDGSQTVPADSGGATATGYTFLTASSNTGATSIGFVAHSNSNGASSHVTAISTFTTGALASINPQTSTLTMTEFDAASVSGPKYAFFVTTKAASVFATAGTGLYFDFSSDSINYRLWFNTGTEVAPAAGGRTLIVCNLLPTMLAPDVAIQLANVISRFQNYPITVTGQPANGGGSYFTFDSNGLQTAVWFKVAGAGTAPAMSSLVEVDLDGTETAAQVATKIQTAINSAFFRVPDLRGVFLRGLDNSSSPIWDLDIATRTGLLDSITLTNPGTLEFMQFQEHFHTSSLDVADGTFVASQRYFTDTGVVAQTNTVTSSLSGGTETRPVNIAVNYFIKY